MQGVGGALPFKDHHGYAVGATTSQRGRLTRWGYRGVRM